MILGKDALPLLEEFNVANEIEANAVKELRDYMQAGGKDEAILIELTNKMEETHNKKMELYQQVQKFKLDSD